MRPIFVDTSGWIALVNISDSLHEKATRVYYELFDDGCLFVTHQAVMLEVGNGLSSVRKRRMAVGLHKRFSLTDRYELAGITNDLYENAWELFEKRPDKDWGIVDCISFVLMRQQGIEEALTADKHFEQAGFRRLIETIE